MILRLLIPRLIHHDRLVGRVQWCRAKRVEVVHTHALARYHKSRMHVPNM
jgi:hypothetical protein